jgi:hypothetical protein
MEITENTPRHSVALVQGVSEVVKQRKAVPGDFYIKETEEKFTTADFVPMAAKTFWWIIEDGKYVETKFKKAELPEGIAMKKPGDEDEYTKWAQKVTAVTIILNRQYHRPVNFLAKGSSLYAWESILTEALRTSVPIYAQEYTLTAEPAKKGPHFVPKITFKAKLSGDDYQHAKSAFEVVNGLKKYASVDADSAQEPAPF